MSFYLFETLHCSPETGLRFLDRHLARLASSARALHFACDPDRIRSEALAHTATVSAAGPHRMRIALERSGAFEITESPLQPFRSSPARMLFGPRWGFAPQHSFDPLLQHKTSRRSEYDRSWKLAESQGAFDMLFTNERGELTEGGRTNLFLQISGRWYTPPLASGVLPGIMRGILLEDEQLGAKERTLNLEDLLKAGRVLLCNSLRGRIEVELEPAVRALQTAELAALEARPPERAQDGQFTG